MTSWRPARRAITMLFLLNGAVTASVDASIPRLSAGTGISTGAMGAALLISSLAAIGAMRVAAMVIRRTGSRPVLWSAAVVVPVVLIIPLSAHGLTGLCVGLVVAGACEGTYDVALQTQAVNVEKVAGRAILGGVHAAWSVGAIVGGLWVGLASWLGWSVAEQAMVFAALTLPVAAMMGRTLLRDAADTAGTPTGGRRASARTRRDGYLRVIVLLGLVGAGCELAESGIGTWCGVYAHRVGGIPLRLAPLILVAFTVAVTVGRVLCDRLRRRYPPETVIRGGAGVAAAGLIAVLAGRPMPLLFAGFGLLGIGLSVAVPILVSAVGRADSAGGATGGRIADYGTLSSIGMLSGPAAFGWIGQAAGFRASFALTALTLAGLVVFARLTGFGNGGTGPAPDEVEAPAESLTQVPV